MERLGALTRRSKAFLTFFLGISTMNPYVSITRYEVANLHLHMKPINDVHEIHLHFLYHRHDRTTPPREALATRNCPAAVRETIFHA